MQNVGDSIKIPKEKDKFEESSEVQSIILENEQSYNSSKIEEAKEKPLVLQPLPAQPSNQIDIRP